MSTHGLDHFLQEVFPVNIPIEVCKMIAQTVWTHVWKRKLVDDFIKWRGRGLGEHVIVVEIMTAAGAAKRIFFNYDTHTRILIF